MNYDVTDKEVKEKILTENPVPSNTKGTPISESYIKVLLFENKKTLTLNHEEASSAVFGPLL